MASPVVRPLLQDEWREFAAIRLEALSNNPNAFSSTYGQEVGHSEEEWRSWLLPQEQCVFGLFDDRDLVGITGVVTSRDYVDGDVGVIFSVYLKPEYRGRGLARLLYDACIRWAIRHSPWRKLIVSHRQDNPVSGKAIRQHAFAYTHTVSKTWASDGMACDEVCYEMNLEKLRTMQ